jgi:DNA-binding GntR family transcriptional regulator
LTTSLKLSPARPGAVDPPARRSGPEAEDRVVQLVNEAIQAHSLMPGQRLVERELSLAAGASRMAVRNGLLRLAQAGLVDLNRNRGATVVRCSPEVARQIMQARIVNEEAALVALAGRLDEAGRDRLQAILRAEAEAYDDGRIEEARHRSREFHVAFTELAGNPMIARFVRELIDYQPLLATMRAGHLSTFSGVAAHTKTLAALLRGEGAEAAAINTELLMSLERELLKDSSTDEDRRPATSPN